MTMNDLIKIDTIKNDGINIDGIKNEYVKRHERNTMKIDSIEIILIMNDGQGY